VKNPRGEPSLTNQGEARWRSKRPATRIDVLLPERPGPTAPGELDRTVERNRAQQSATAHGVQDDEALAVGAMPKQDIAAFRQPHMRSLTNGCDAIVTCAAIDS
jgi:hypothetical protein